MRCAACSRPRRRWPASSSTLPGRYRASPRSSNWSAPATATRCSPPAALPLRRARANWWCAGWSNRRPSACFAWPSRRTGVPTPLTQHTMRLLTALVREASRLIISRIARAGRPCRIAIAVIGGGRWRSAGRLATVRAANSPFPSRPPRRARGKPDLGRRQEMLGPSSRIAQWEHASMFRRTFLTCATFGAMSAPALPNAPIGRLGLAVQ